MSDRSTLKTKLDRLTSKIVRLRDKWCVCCGLPVEYNDKGDPVTNDCGHFLGRKVDATRWDLRNCNCQCRSCNWKHNDNPMPYVDYMLSHYGSEIVIELKQLYLEHIKITIPDLREMITEYKEIYHDLLMKQ